MKPQLRFVIDEDEVEAISPWKARSSIETFQENISNSFRSDLAMPVLVPPGLISVSENSDIIVFERPPRYQMIKYVPCGQMEARNANPDTVREFVIALPWQIYIAEFEANGILCALKMFFAPKEVLSGSIHEDGDGAYFGYVMDDEFAPIYIPTLPNIYSNYNFCIDQLVDYGGLFSIESRINYAYSAVWDTVFNNDLLDTFNNGISSRGGFINDRFGVTIEDPEDFFRFWENFSISELLDNLPIFSGSANAGKWYLEMHNASSHQADKMIHLIPQLI